MRATHLLHFWQRQNIKSQLNIRTAVSRNKNHWRWTQMMQAGEKCVHEQNTPEVCRWSTRYISLHLQRIWYKAVPRVVQWWDIYPYNRTKRRWMKQIRVRLIVCITFAHIWLQAFSTFAWPLDEPGPTLFLRSHHLPLLRNEWASKWHNKLLKSLKFSTIKCVWNWSPNGENMMRPFFTL